jgi:ribosomal protein L9
VESTPNIISLEVVSTGTPFGNFCRPFLNSLYILQNVKRKMRKAHIIEGQVTAGSIVDAVARQKRIGLEREVVMLKKPIIELGTFNVPLGITLANGEQASLTVVVGP